MERRGILRCKILMLVELKQNKTKLTIKNAQGLFTQIFQISLIPYFLARYSALEYSHWSRDGLGWLKDSPIREQLPDAIVLCVAMAFWCHGTMVSTREKALARKDVVTQTECPHTAVQVSGCSKCLSMLPLAKGGRDSTFVRHEQVDDLLNMVVKLKEELERLIQCEQEIDWWSNSPLNLQERHKGDTS